MPKRESRTYDPWYRLATSTGAKIRQHYGAPDARTEARMVRAFRAALRPRKKAGRRPDDVTARAAEKWASGMEAYPAVKGQVSLRLYQRLLWQRIYREVIPDFARLDKLTRQYRTSLLRRNVKACLRRQGCKWSRGIRVTTTKPARKRVVLSAAQSAAE